MSPDVCMVITLDDFRQFGNIPCILQRFIKCDKGLHIEVYLCIISILSVLSI